MNDCDMREDEKYFWTSEDGTKIPKHELNDLHICNIVAKYGKKYLAENGHLLLVRRFEELNKEHKFFDMHTPILTDNERAIFQSYIEDAKVTTPFGNSDWNEIYDKIVKGNWSSYAIETRRFYSNLD